MHKVFKSLQPNRRWQTKGQSPARQKKQPRFLTHRFPRRRYERVVGALLEQTVNSCAQNYSVNSERKDHLSLDDSGSDDEPPPPVELIVLEDDLNEQGRQYFLEACAHPEDDEPEDYATSQSYKDGRQEEDETDEGPFRGKENWYEMMLVLEYKGIPTTQLPDEIQMGNQKAPGNIADILDRKLEMVLDL